MFKFWLILGCFSLDLVISQDANECFQMKEGMCSSDYIKYWYYSHAHPLGRQLEQAKLGTFDYTPPASLKVLIHGFNSSYTDTPNAEILPKLINVPNINIISVDYTKVVPDPCYLESVQNAPHVGVCLGNFLETLVKIRQVQPENMHLIGYGIGAHVASFASNYLARSTAKVGQITGLDPAKPMYLTPDLTQRLDPSDAEFVDVIHTDVFISGILQPIGHADFYPNMGVTQPNCGPINILSTHECYHKRSAQYYAESISLKNNFLGFYCEDLHAFVSNECQPNPGRDMAPMGFYVPHNTRGSYFLSTFADSPYAKGYDFTNIDRSLFGKTYLGDSFLSKIAHAMDARRGDFAGPPQAQKHYEREFRQKQRHRHLAHS